MPRLIDAPAVVEAAGTPPKIIEEFVGRVRTGDEGVSIARMRSPQGWSEPFQKPEFDEYTMVLDGMLLVESDEGQLEVRAGQAVTVKGGDRVRYSSPEEGGAHYVAVCLPAFSIDTVHREDAE
ncbi:MAG: cupin domain-containing protein [Planctomycetota bacterium]|jgi:mannose-6-phosphate isomerase-like protein (cupin superfamily)